MAELAEVRDFPRTFDTNSTAFYWQSTRSNWNNVIDRKIFEYRLDDNPPRAARISVVESLHEVGDGNGSAAPEIGYSWYAGI